MIEALDIQVKGIVQGVGFRPFVYRMAKKYLVNGWVLNAADGVFVHAEGEGKLLDEFVLELSENPPAASRVEEVALKEVPIEGFDSFEIRFSDAAAVEKTTLVSPDLATCDDCARELFNPNDRRYRYPFINCTNCGPRFTIIEKLPYDRASTSMKDFPLCERCASEYGDPLDRRFHAQPNACFACGPQVSWREHEGGDVSAPLGPVSWGATREESDAIFARAARLLAEGGIVAMKGLGGFHLVCDANNPEAVAKLRARKRREGKAFAVMAASVDDARQVCEVGDEEAGALAGPQRPIVLMRKRPDATFAPGLADRLPELGVMLPYTPMQHLLLHDFADVTKAAKARGCGHIPLLVMTSGNLHDEPIVIDDEDAYEKLFDVADAFLGHNRAIRTRYDDSVVRVIAAGSAGRAVQFIRRARGYAPLPISLASQPAERADAAETLADVGGPATAARRHSVFAAGSEQKNTFTLTRDAEAFVSQHIGDMENAETYDAWLAAKSRYEALFEIAPTLLACDLHPEYLASKWARERSRACGLPLAEVQHHHAHIAAVLGEHGLEGPVCGIAFDGTGYGADGAIWGGEVLLANRTAFERFANFVYVPMPGGAAAVRHPLRMAYGALWAFDLLDHPGAARALEALGEQAAVCEQMIEHGINTPQTSSVGRLFDAASALLGICTAPTYEGEPAILLEAAIDAAELDGAPPSDSVAASFAVSSTRCVAGGFDAERTNVSRETCSAEQEKFAGQEKLTGREESAGREEFAGWEGSAGQEGLADREESASWKELADREGSAAQEKLAGWKVSAGQDESAGREESAEREEFAEQEESAGRDESTGRASAGQGEFAGREMPVSQGESAGREEGDETAASERYAIAVLKNTATSSSTAQDTSVVLFDAAPCFRALLDDVVAGVPVSVIARRFHDAFVQAIVTAAELARALYGIEAVALSGGVFMNRYLVEHALAALEAAGFTVAVNRDLPPNDGCVSFGQAVVAWAANEEGVAEGDV